MTNGPIGANALAVLALVVAWGFFQDLAASNSHTGGVCGGVTWKRKQRAMHFRLVRRREPVPPFSKVQSRDPPFLLVQATV